MTHVQTSAEQAREQARVQAEQAREQAEQAREQAAQAREQAREAEAQARRIQDEVNRAMRDIRINIPRQQQPGTVALPPWQREPDIPPQVVDMVGMVTFATAAVLILRPLMRAFANRFERRGTPMTALPPDVTAHLQRMEQAIEAVAIEVERISEGQRYTTKLLAERAERVGKEV